MPIVPMVPLRLGFPSTLFPGTAHHTHNRLPDMYYTFFMLQYLYTQRDGPYAEDKKGTNLAEERQTDNKNNHPAERTT